MKARMTLEDAARRLGVAVRREWSFGEGCGDLECPDCSEPRPRLDVAMECLGKLPEKFLEHYCLEYRAEHLWHTFYLPYTEKWGVEGTFEEAVTALAERFLESRST